MSIPYTAIKAAHDSGTPLTGYLKTMADKVISDHNSRIANSSWWGNPVGQFQHSSTTDADWINALSSSTIGARSRDSTWSSSFDIPYYESFVGQSGSDSYGYGDARDAIGMSPQAFLGNIKYGYAGKVFNDVAIPMYGADGNVTGYAVPSAYIEPEYRIDKESGRDDHWAELSYKLNYDEGKLGENAVKAKLPGIGNAYLFKGEQQFNDVFGANPEPEFKSIIHKPERKGFFDVAIPAAAMFFSANSLATSFGSFLNGSASGLGSFGGSEIFGPAMESGAMGTTSTGGLLVGSDGVLGSTGNAIGDQVLNSAGQNAIQSGLTGNDPLEGALTGAVGGLIGASGVGQSVASGLELTGDAATAVTTGVNAGLGAGATTALSGGSFSDVITDAATAGLSQGAGSYVGNSVDSGYAAIDRGLGGATAGGINAALTGGDVGTGILTGGVAGAAGGLATDLGASPVVSGAVQGVTGGLVNSALQPDAVVNPPPTPTTTPTTPATTPEVSSVSFVDVIPEWMDVSRSTEWGRRLIDAGRI